MSAEKRVPEGFEHIDEQTSRGTMGECSRSFELEPSFCSAVRVKNRTRFHPDHGPTPGGADDYTLFNQPHGRYSTLIFMSFPRSYERFGTLLRSRICVHVNAPRGFTKRETIATRKPPGPKFRNSKHPSRVSDKQEKPPEDPFLRTCFLPNYFSFV